jgi:predicted ArsR family transcriptional regulator
MDLPRRPGDLLTQPTRARLFRELGDLRRPVGTEEMAGRLGLHPNGVRVHLERLLEAGLVVRERPRETIGRPRDMWSIAPSARPGGDPPRAYIDLGRWLARVMSRGKTSLRAVEASGREIGRTLAPEGGAGSREEQMYGALVSLGFQPEREVNPAGALTYTLCNCPYRDVARESQQVVCTLHRGVTRGLLDVIAPETQLAAFVPRDPDTAGCLIELRGDLADEAVVRDSTTGATDASA